MRRLLSFVVVLCAVLAPSAASAGLVLGGRLGVGIPGGDVFQSAKLADLVDFTVPLQFDLGYRFTKVTVGGYLRLGAGKLDPAVADGCDAAGVSCRVLDVGLGAQIDVRLASGNAGPWLGGYIGAETLRYDEAVGGSAWALSFTGWELGAQGGIDFAWGVMTLGPYGAIGLGQFTSGTFELGGAKITGDITDKATHTWLQLGVRAGFAF